MLYREDRSSIDAVETCEPGDICEVYLVVRPEEKFLVARALEGQVGAIFTCFPALGRGLEGGLAYAGSGRAAPARRRLIDWPRKEPLATFLPKAVFYLVLPTELVAVALEAARIALRTAGGPAECARGFAWISPILDELPVGAVREETVLSRAAAPAPMLSCEAAR